MKVEIMVYKDGVRKGMEKKMLSSLLPLDKLTYLKSIHETN